MSESLDAILGQIEAIDQRLEQRYEARGKLLADKRALNDPNGDALLSFLAANPEADIPDTDAELAAMTREILTLENARTALHARADAARTEAQEAKVSAADVRHRGIVSELAKKGVELGKLVLQEMECRDSVALPGKTYADRLRPMGIGFGFFDIRVPSSGICAYVREAVLYGYLTGRESWLEGVNFRYEHSNAPAGFVNATISASPSGGAVSPASYVSNFVHAKG